METRHSEWLDSDSPRSDMVVSCRIRLARNLSHMPFCHRASAEQLRRIVALVAPVIESCPQMADARSSTIEKMSHQERAMLVEQHIISKELAKKTEGRAVVHVPDGKLSVMINEEDHVRIQSLDAGMRLRRAYTRTDEVEDALNGQIEFAFSNTFGYLTACPTNVGTGLRASVMVHLPALVLSKQLSDVLPRVSEKGFAIRGFYGEGTEAFGDFYQMSNQKTLGLTEREIIETLEAEVNSVLAEEARARDRLVLDEPRRCEDTVWRTVGTLSQVRILSYEEFMSLLSRVRLGIALDILTGYDRTLLDRLMIDMQPAHIVKSLGRELDPFALDCARADLVREVFSDGAG